MNREAELEMEIEIKSKLIKKVDTDAEDCDSCDSTYNLFCGHHQQMADIYFKDMKLLKAELQGIVDTENRIKEEIDNYYFSLDKSYCVEKKELLKRLFGDEK